MKKRPIIELMIIIVFASFMSSPAYSAGDDDEDTCPSKDLAPPNMPVECPAVSPNGAASFKDDYFQMDDRPIPVPNCVRNHMGEETAIFSSLGHIDLQCRYTDGQLLYTALPEPAYLCRGISYSEPPKDKLAVRSRCYSTLSGDVKKDRVTFHEVHPLTRAFALLGVRLDMTAIEATDALSRLAPTNLQSANARITAETADGNQITILLSPKGLVREVLVKRDDIDFTLFHSLKETLGTPTVPGPWNEHPLYWGKARFEDDHDDEYRIKTPGEDRETIRMEAKITWNDTERHQEFRLMNMPAAAPPNARRNDSPPVSYPSSALVRAVIPELPPEENWQEGTKITGYGTPHIRSGTAIATFTDGAYRNYANGDHAAIFLGYETLGNVKGISVVEQFDSTKYDGRTRVSFYPMMKRPYSKYWATAFSVIDVKPSPHKKRKRKKHDDEDGD